MAAVAWEVERCSDVVVDIRFGTTFVNGSLAVRPIDFGANQPDFEEEESLYHGGVGLACF